MSEEILMIAINTVDSDFYSISFDQLTLFSNIENLYILFEKSGDNSLFYRIPTKISEYDLHKDFNNIDILMTFCNEDDNKKSTIIEDDYIKQQIIKESTEICSHKFIKND